MEIKRKTSQKPEFCDEKKPLVKKKKKKGSKRVPPVNKIRQTAYVSDLHESCPSCQGERKVVDSKEALLIIEEEIKQWPQYL